MVQIFIYSSYVMNATRSLNENPISRDICGLIGKRSKMFSATNVTRVLLTIQIWMSTFKQNTRGWRWVAQLKRVLWTTKVHLRRKCSLKNRGLWFLFLSMRFEANWKKIGSYPNRRSVPVFHQKWNYDSVEENSYVSLQ